MYHLGLNAKQTCVMPMAVPLCNHVAMGAAALWHARTSLSHSSSRFYGCRRHPSVSVPSVTHPILAKSGPSGNTSNPIGVTLKNLSMELINPIIMILDTKHI